ncbi:MAG: hypothetical protein WCA38_08600 [Candidatus Acidiferrales bacterium]
MIDDELVARQELDRHYQNFSAAGLAPNLDERPDISNNVGAGKLFVSTALRSLQRGVPSSWFFGTASMTASATTALRLTPHSKSICPASGARHLVLAALYGQLGERDAARRGLWQLLLLQSEFAAAPQQELRKLGSLRKTGLEVAGDGRAAAAKPAAGPGS